MPGPDFFHDINILEVGFHRIVGLHRRVRIDVADRPVVIGADLEPVVDAAEHDVAGDDRGDRAVVEFDVHHGEIIDVVIVAADVPLIAKAGRARDGVRSRGDGLGPDRRPAAGPAFHALQIKGRGQRMAALADQHSAAAAGGMGVVDRMRSAVRLLAVNPENLSPCFLEDFSLLLDRRGVDPVLRIEQSALAVPLRLEDPVDAGQGRLQGDLHVGAGPVEIGRAVAKIAGERFFADHELAALQGGDRGGFVGHRRHADVNGIHLAEEVAETRERPDTPFVCERFAAVGILGEHTDDFDVDAVDLLQGLEMKR